MLLNSLDDFEYLEPPHGKVNLGEGAFSQVRLVKLKANNKLYALKEVYFLKKNPT